MSKTPSIKNKKRKQPTDSEDDAEESISLSNLFTPFNYYFNGLQVPQFNENDINVSETLIYDPYNRHESVGNHLYNQCDFFFKEKTFLMKEEHENAEKVATTKDWPQLMELVENISENKLKLNRHKAREVTAMKSVISKEPSQPNYTDNLSSSKQSKSGKRSVNLEALKQSHDTKTPNALKDEFFVTHINRLPLDKKKHKDITQNLLIMMKIDRMVKNLMIKYLKEFKLISEDDLYKCFQNEIKKERGNNILTCKKYFRSNKVLSDVYKSLLFSPHSTADEDTSKTTSSRESTSPHNLRKPSEIKVKEDDNTPSLYTWNVIKEMKYRFVHYDNAASKNSNTVSVSPKSVDVSCRHYLIHFGTSLSQLSINKKEDWCNQYVKKNKKNKVKFPLNLKTRYAHDNQIIHIPRELYNNIALDDPESHKLMLGRYPYLKVLRQISTLLLKSKSKKDQIFGTNFFLDAEKVKKRIEHEFQLSYRYGKSRRRKFRIHCIKKMIPTRQNPNKTGLIGAQDFNFQNFATTVTISKDEQNNLKASACIAMNGLLKETLPYEKKKEKSTSTTTTTTTAGGSKKPNKGSKKRNKLVKLYHEREYLMKQLRQWKTSKLNKLNNKNGVKKKKIRRKMKKLTQRIRNSRKHHHHHRAKYNLDRHFLFCAPPLSSKILQKGKEVYPKAYKQPYLSLFSNKEYIKILYDKQRHYKDSIVISDTEYYTSKTCGSCYEVTNDDIPWTFNNISKFGCEFQFITCPYCKVSTFKHVNDAFNILVKTLNDAPLFLEKKNN
jgi:hypothetical protein